MNFSRFSAVLSLCLVSLAPDLAIAGNPKGAAIADPSDWDVVITYSGGATQKAVIRLRQGTIYPAINNVPSGKVYVDETGLLHVLFNGHPKVASGEAILRKPANGKWEGVLTQASGESRIDMKRK